MRVPLLPHSHQSLCPPPPSAACSGDNCLQGSLSLHFWGQLPPPTFPDPFNAVKGGLRSLPAKGRGRKADFPEKKLTHPGQLIYLARPFLPLRRPCSARSPLSPKEQGRPCSWQPGPVNPECPCCSSEPAATEGVCHSFQEPLVQGREGWC